MSQELIFETKAVKVPFWNKSLITNLIAASVVVLGYLSPYFQEQFIQTGLFALSGALTNWLAIHMLFEKVPGLYGSGIIPNRFEDFKAGIKSMMMEQFFTSENIERFLQGGKDNNIDFSKILDILDFEMLFEKLVVAIESTPLRQMLAMMGGRKALEPLKPAFMDKMKEALRELGDSPSFQEAVKKGLSEELSSDKIKEKVDTIIYQRLEELTPQMVKVIIQNMIRQHLGWLVVWGGVFGGLIGFGFSFMP